MLIAMFAMILFGAILVVPLLLKAVAEEPQMRLATGDHAASPTRQRWSAVTVREKRRVHAHGRAKTRIKSAHHAGL